VTHVHGGYQVWIIHGALLVYGLSSDDVIFNTSDIGWIVGQSYIVFAPTIMGATSVLLDGVIDSPKPDVFWEIVERYKPTLIMDVADGVQDVDEAGGAVRQAPRPQ
jgi:acetyl-CoA synthetase